MDRSRMAVYQTPNLKSFCIPSHTLLSTIFGRFLSQMTHILEKSKDGLAAFSKVFHGNKSKAAESPHIRPRDRCRFWKMEAYGVKDGGVIVDSHFTFRKSS